MTDQIKFACMNCGKHLAARSEHAGRTTRCPTCQLAVTVPTAKEFEEEHEEQEYDGEEYGDEEYDESDEGQHEHLPDTSPSFAERTRALGSDLKEELVPVSGIPRDVRQLIHPDEPVLFAGNPSQTVLFFKLAVTGLIALLLFVGGLIQAGFSLHLLFIGSTVVGTVAYLIYIGWKTKFFVITSHRVITRTGWFNRSITFAAVSNIQMVAINTGFIDRWLGLNTIVFSTAATSGFGRFQTGVLVFANVHVEPILRAYGIALQER